MSAATDFLRSWFERAKVRSPSITRVSAQPWPGIGTPPHFKPGVASYGWGINGHLQKDQNDVPVALVIATYVWFSDRGQDLSNAPPNAGQQFEQSESARELMTFAIDGDSVRLTLKSLTYGFQFDAYTDVVDEPSQQLVFSNMPPAGPDPVRSVLIVAFGDTGQFGWA